MKQIIFLLNFFYAYVYIQKSYIFNFIRFVNVKAPWFLHYIFWLFIFVCFTLYRQFFNDLTIDTCLESHLLQIIPNNWDFPQQIFNKETADPQVCTVTTLLNCLESSFVSTVGPRVGSDDVVRHSISPSIWTIDPWGKHSDSVPQPRHYKGFIERDPKFDLIKKIPDKLQNGIKFMNMNNKVPAKKAVKDFWSISDENIYFFCFLFKLSEFV